MSNITDKIQTLSKSSNKLSSSKEERLTLVNELIQCLQEEDWVHVGNWIRHELVLTQRLDPSQLNDAILPSQAQEAATSIRFAIGTIVMGYLTTVKESLEYQLGITTKKPELLSKVRTEMTPEGSVNIHGPCPTPVAGGPTFEAWCSPVSPSSSDGKSSSSATPNTNTTKDEGGITLVLGAGNASHQSLVDVLHSIFHHPQKPVLLKHHPIRPFLHHVCSVIFKPLIQRGYFDQTFDEGIEHTQTMLMKNELVQHIHVTGSYLTSQSIKSFIMKERNDVNEENVKEMVTSELGCASPWILSNGVYEDVELRNAAKLIAQAKKTAAGTFCISANVLILPEHFPQKDKFLSYVSDELSTRPTEPCYYPGSTTRCQSIIRHYQDMGDDTSRITTTKAPFIVEGESKGDDSQITVVHCGVFGKEDYDDKASITEAFGPVLAVVELPHSSNDTNDDDANEQYLLETAIPFVNDKTNIFGSLNGIILTPSSMKKSTINKAIAKMKYGTVAVNIWSLFGFLAMTKGAVWGGHGRDGAGQSGDGYVGNSYDIEGMEKTVVYGPSLMNEPAKDPPTIVFDVLNQITVSKSGLRAFVNVWMLLVIRTFSAFLPSFVKGKKIYGAAY